MSADEYVKPGPAAPHESFSDEERVALRKALEDLRDTYNLTNVMPNETRLVGESPLARAIILSSVKKNIDSDQRSGKYGPAGITRLFELAGINLHASSYKNRISTVAMMAPRYIGKTIEEIAENLQNEQRTRSVVAAAIKASRTLSTEELLQAAEALLEVVRTRLVETNAGALAMADQRSLRPSRKDSSPVRKAQKNIDQKEQNDAIPYEHATLSREGDGALEDLIAILMMSPPKRTRDLLATFATKDLTNSERFNSVQITIPTSPLWFLKLLRATGSQDVRGFADFISKHPAIRPFIVGNIEKPAED